MHNCFKFEAKQICKKGRNDFERKISLNRFIEFSKDFKLLLFKEFQIHRVAFDDDLDGNGKLFVIRYSLMHLAYWVHNEQPFRIFNTQNEISRTKNEQIRLNWKPDWLMIPMGILQGITNNNNLNRKICMHFRDVNVFRKFHVSWDRLLIQYLQ